MTLQDIAFAYVGVGMVLLTMVYLFSEFNRRVFETFSFFRMLSVYMAIVLLWPGFLILVVHANLSPSTMEAIKDKMNRINRKLDKAEKPMEPYGSDGPGVAGDQVAPSIFVGRNEKDDARDSALLNDFSPITMQDVQPFLRELDEKDPKTQKEVLAIAAKHGFCWDTFGRMIRIPGGGK